MKNDFVPATMNEQLEKLFHHVTGPCGHVPSACMLAVKEAMTDSLRSAVLSGRASFRPLMDVEDRIARHIAFVSYGTIFFPRVSGEWHITNADLEMWADLCLFGERDFLPKQWRQWSSSIGEVLHNKRRWQTYERYIAGGGLRGEHRKLLRKLIWDMDLHRGDWISLYVQGKRPFGNSSRESQIHRLLGWPVTWDEGADMPADVMEKCWEVFDELQFAVCDALAMEARMFFGEPEQA